MKSQDISSVTYKKVTKEKKMTIMNKIVTPSMRLLVISCLLLTATLSAVVMPKPPQATAVSGIPGVSTGQDDRSWVAVNVFQTHFILSGYRANSGLGQCVFPIGYSADNKDTTHNCTWDPNITTRTDAAVSTAWSYAGDTIHFGITRSRPGNDLEALAIKYCDIAASNANKDCASYSGPIWSTNNQVLDYRSGTINYTLPNVTSLTIRRFAICFSTGAGAAVSKVGCNSDNWAAFNVVIHPKFADPKITAQPTSPTINLGTAGKTCFTATSGIPSGAYPAVTGAYKWSATAPASWQVANNCIQTTSATEVGTWSYTGSYAYSGGGVSANANTSKATITVNPNFATPSVTKQFDNNTALHPGSSWTTVFNYNATKNYAAHQNVTTWSYTLNGGSIQSGCPAGFTCDSADNYASSARITTAGIVATGTYKIIATTGLEYTNPGNKQVSKSATISSTSTVTVTPGTGSRVEFNPEKSITTGEADYGRDNPTHCEDIYEQAGIGCKLYHRFLPSDTREYNIIPLNPTIYDSVGTPNAAGSIIWSVTPADSNVTFEGNNLKIKKGAKVGNRTISAHVNGGNNSTSHIISIEGLPIYSPDAIYHVKENHKADFDLHIDAYPIPVSGSCENSHAGKTSINFATGILSIVKDDLEASLDAVTMTGCAGVSYYYEDIKDAQHRYTGKPFDVSIAIDYGVQRHITFENGDSNYFKAGQTATIVWTATDTDGVTHTAIDDEVENVTLKSSVAADTISGMNITFADVSSSRVLTIQATIQNVIVSMSKTVKVYMLPSHVNKTGDNKITGHVGTLVDYDIEYTHPEDLHHTECSENIPDGLYFDNNHDIKGTPVEPADFIVTCHGVVLVDGGYVNGKDFQLEFKILGDPKLEIKPSKTNPSIGETITWTTTYTDEENNITHPTAVLSSSEKGDSFNGHSMTPSSVGHRTITGEVYINNKTTTVTYDLFVYQLPALKPITTTAKVGDNVRVQLSLSAGYPNVITGVNCKNLPPGLQLNTNSWQLEGVLSKAGDFIAQCQAQNSFGQGEWASFEFKVSEIYVTVTFNSNGGSPTPSKQSVVKGTTAQKPSDPKRSGYTFAGWYTTTSTSGEKWNFTTPTTKNVTLYAHWDKVVVKTPTTTGTGTTPKAVIFDDVTKSNAFFDDIAWIYTNGITTGCATGQAGHVSYCPKQNVTRGQMAAFIHRLAGKGTYTNTNCGFVDIGGAYAPFASDICWLKSTGITTGVDSTHYAPASPVTRGQMASFLHRLVGNTGAGSSSCGFADIGGAYAPAAIDICWLKSTGITTGVDSTHYAPAAFVTREQMAAFIHRMVSKNLVVKR